MKHWLLITLLAVGLVPGTMLQAQQPGEGPPANETVYELQVRNLPPAGRAWRAIRPVEDMQNVRVLDIDMDTSRVVIRATGELDRRAIKQALEQSGLLLVYITERES